MSRTVALVMDPAAGERGSYGRLLAYVHVDRTDFNASLVDGGLARVYTEGDSSREKEYLALEERAQLLGVGLWECETATSPPSGTCCAGSETSCRAELRPSLPDSLYLAAAA